MKRSDQVKSNDPWSRREGVVVDVNSDGRWCDVMWNDERGVVEQAPCDSVDVVENERITPNPGKDRMMKIYENRPEGNAFAIMATVRGLLRDTGRKDEWPEVQKRMMSGDYQNLADVAKEVSYGSIEVVRNEDMDDEYDDE